MHGASPAIPFRSATDKNGEQDTAPPSPSRLQQTSPLLTLPLEILDSILSLLSPITLARLSSTCHSLSHHASANRHWSPFLSPLVPTPSPYPSWKSLYSAHYPYWHLPLHKIWFSDKATLAEPFVGQLILSRYDPRTNNIEAYRLVAEHAPITALYPWPHDARVRLYDFCPRVSLFLDDPVVRLSPEAYKPGSDRLRTEILLQRGTVRRADAIRACIFPAIRIPPSRQSRSMALWPPATIPAEERVRNDSSTLFMDAAHKPRSAAEDGDMATTAFRTRKWMAFGGMSERLGLRMAEDVMTWATLPPSCYVPSREKPYQGIWVGDYNGHGCEFLVIIQRVGEEARVIPRVRPRGGENAMAFVQGLVGAAAGGEDNEGSEDAESFVSAEETLEEVAEVNEGAATSRPTQDHDEAPYGDHGRLDAIKLTGDLNVPRGEPTWIAEDIGREGLLRVADESWFSGVRVVKSWGHVAAPAFTNDTYTRAQLFLISHDTLAQYWEEMHHISYFKRINVDDYLRI